MIYTAIQNLIDYGIEHQLIAAVDELVVRNLILDSLQIDEWQEPDFSVKPDSIDEILKPLIDFACEQGVISDTANSRDLFDTKLMGHLTPMPREIITEFEKRYNESPELATDWYYKNSQDLNYVRAGRIAKDLRWEYTCEYGALDITINCSKPEKDPRDIAAAKTQKNTSYPKCQLCPENAGFTGTATYPARQNLRPIPMTVGGEGWQMQYSPYGYYSEHCIVFNNKHIPMKIDGAIFGKLFDILDFLPHYFIGSNADLPIVGGSILTHEHFQGGKYTFAMEKAPIETEFTIPQFTNVKAGIVKWPMSVIRLSSKDRNLLADCCNLVLERWREYSDETVNILAETDGVPHNTITPIARKKNGEYECDLVLRSNITTKERPLGLFHPNPELHHIKKENIGLIEVMGLAVLPSRLVGEIKILEKTLLSGQNLAEVSEIAHHAKWANEILEKHPELNKDNATDIIKQEIGAVFLEVLKDAGVFKCDTQGKNAFLRFIDSIK